MARSKSLIAIFLALTLLVSPTAGVLADGPPPLRDEANELDGHPWDDGSNESSTDPGTDPNTPGPGSVTGDQTSGTVPTTLTAGSGPQFVAQLARMIIGKWLRLSEIKFVKGKSVRRIR